MDELESFVLAALSGVGQRVRRAGGGGGGGSSLYDSVLRRGSRSSCKPASGLARTRGPGQTLETSAAAAHEYGVCSFATTHERVSEQVEQDCTTNLRTYASETATTSAAFWDSSCHVEALHPSLERASVSLHAVETWRRFHAFGTEMIVTKIGRGMFPRLRIGVSGLDPEARYSIAVDFVPVDSKRYRYTFPTSRWTVTGHADVHLPGRWHVHPSSPAEGKVWMKEIVSFDKLKITNSNQDQNGYIILNSMHKYQPRVHVIYSGGDPDVGNNSDTLAISEALMPRHGTHRMFVFEETQFIAVTAYQNPRITQMKIAENPFARGFRKFDDESMEECYVDSPSHSSDGQSGGGCCGSSSSSSSCSSSSSSNSSPLHEMHSPDIDSKTAVMAAVLRCSQPASSSAALSSANDALSLTVPPLATAVAAAAQHYTSSIGVAASAAAYSSTAGAYASNLCTTARHTPLATGDAEREALTDYRCGMEQSYAAEPWYAAAAAATSGAATAAQENQLQSCQSYYLHHHYYHHYYYGGGEAGGGGGVQLGDEGGAAASEYYRPMHTVGDYWGTEQHQAAAHF